MADEPKYMSNDQPLQALSKTPKELFRIALEEFVDKTKLVFRTCFFTCPSCTPTYATWLEQDIECGLMSEKLCREALTAYLSREENDMERVVASTIGAASPSLRTDQPLANEILYGRAGILFLLRLVRHWVPTSKARLDAHMKAVAARIMEANNHG
ncbi:hypothetical protein MY4824_009743 [Beauveria thailandica]